MSSTGHFPRPFLRSILRRSSIATAIALLVATTATAEDRSIDGSGNNLNPSFFNAGQAGREMARLGYDIDYPGDGSGDTLLTALDRANPRDVSNAIAAQTGNLFNARNMSDFVWSWGQFLDHDISLSKTNSLDTANIPISQTSDTLFSASGIPFSRSEYTTVQNNVNGQLIDQREQMNEITSYIDASSVYGSDLLRSDTLRERQGGMVGGGVLLPTLRVGPGNLLPENTFGLDNDNGPGFTPPAELFVAGDIRANENVVLTSMHTIFHREHNRLVGIIQNQQPGLNSEETYQLARKIVGAQIQKITYDEFLPALFGANAPAAKDYAYSNDNESTITNEFAHAAYRFGHSMLASQLQLVDDSGINVGSLELSDAFFNPDVIKNDPGMIDKLLKGMTTQRAQEIDTLLVDDVRNQLFGPPGAGGMDLASLNIQRGRDHGLPDYNELRAAYGLPKVNSFAEITEVPLLQIELEALYGDVDNIDPWVGGLAEDHLLGSSLGELVTAVMINQFERLRDHDRLFYLSEDAGLYSLVSGEYVLDAAIKSIIDLDQVTLSSLIMSNTGLTSLPENVFFVVPEPASGALLLFSLGATYLLHRHR